MQVLAADGTYADVSHRSWPLAGLNYHAEWTQGWSGLRLASLPTGEARMLAYRRIYKSNPWLWNAVNKKARGLASLPLSVYLLQADGQRRKVRGDLPQGRPGPPSAAQRLDMLFRRPAPGLSRRRLIYRAKVDELIYGNALWIKESDGYGGVARLWNASWRQTSVLGNAATVDGGEAVAEIVGYRYIGTQGTKVFAPDEVVHFGNGDPDAPIAPSPLESLQYTIALYDALSRHLVSFFQNQARPSGVIQMEQMPGDRELRIMREEIAELYSGAENAGRPMITSGKWVPMTGGQSYSDLVELAKLSREEIATAYDIPPPLMGILDKAIKSNVAELREQWLRDVLAGDATAFTDEIDTQLVAGWDALANVVTGFDMEAHLLPDWEALGPTFKELKRIYTLNELRRLVNLPDLPFEWGDQPWMEPGSLPAGLAPQGATVNPDDGTADDDEPGAGEDQDEDNDEDDA